MFYRDVLLQNRDRAGQYGILRETIIRGNIYAVRNDTAPQVRHRQNHYQSAKNRLKKVFEKATISIVGTPRGATLGVARDLTPDSNVKFVF